MRKRRRAYKKYDWKEHQWQLFKHDLTMMMARAMARKIDEAILYGTRSDEPVSVRIAVPDYLLKLVSK